MFASPSLELRKIGPRRMRVATGSMRHRRRPCNLDPRGKPNMFVSVHAYRTDTVEAHRMFTGRLRGEIVALLCLKAVALLAIYQFFFAPLTHPEPDRRAM